MQFAKLSTVANVIVGPILDSAGAEYTGAVIGDLSLSKSDATTLTAMAAAATLTHLTNGYYSLVTIAGNFDTLGRLKIICNKSTYQMPPVEFMVLPATVYAAIVELATDAAGGLGDIRRMAGTGLTARDIGANVLLSSGTGAGQLDFTSGVVKGNVVQLLGTAWLAPGTAGTPDVNAKLWNGLTTVALPLVPATAGRTLVVDTAGLADANVVKVGPTGAGATQTAGDIPALITTVDDLLDTEIADIKAKTDLIPAAPASTTNITAGIITTVTNLTNLPSIPADWITAAGITDGAFTAAKFAASSLNSKGDWNIGKTGYTLTATTGLGNQTADITGNLSGSVGFVGTAGITSGSFAAGAINNAAMSIDGSELTLIPWNTAWDTEVQSEVADALTAFTWSSITIGVVTTLTNLPAITANWLTATGLASDAVTEIRSIVSGTADSGSTTTMVDAARTEADTDYWKDMAILFTSGTISGQNRLITAFDAATDTITFSPATTQAVGTNTYEILPNVAASGAAAPTAAAIADAVWDEDATAHQTQGTFGQAIGDPVADSNTIFKATVTDATGATVGVDVVAIKSETVTILANTNLIKSEVLASGTLGTGNVSTVLNLNTSLGSNDSVNNRLLVLKDVSTGLSSSAWIYDWASSGTLATLWSALPFIPQDSVDTWTIYADIRPIDHPDLLLETTIASLTNQTTFILTDGSATDPYVGRRIVIRKAVAVNTVFSTLISTYTPGTKEIVLTDTPVFTIGINDLVVILTNDTKEIIAEVNANEAKLDIIDDFLDSEITAIKAKTDQFVFTIANQVDANALSGAGGLDAAGVRSAVGLASANLDTQLNTIELRQRGNVIAQGTLGATGNDTTHLHLSGLAYIDDVLIDSLIVIFDVSTGLYYSTWITDWVASTDLATVPILPFIPQASTDTYWLYPSVANAPADSFPTAGAIADEVELRTIAGVNIVNAIADGAIIDDSIAPSAVAKITDGLATTVQLGAAVQEIIDTGQDNWITADCGSGGTGGSSLTFTINDGTDPIEGATVRATYLTTTGLGDTDSSGEVVLGLENGTNLVVITAPGYTSLSTTLVVSGDGAQTYSLDEIVITPSSNPLTTTGYFTVYNYAMSTVAGHNIFYRLVEHPLGSGYGHVQAWQTATSDGSGIIALVLVKGATYEYGTLKTVTEEHYVPLTAGSTWEMPNIIL